jgi:hypothetical protein
VWFVQLLPDHACAKQNDGSHNQTPLNSFVHSTSLAQKKQAGLPLEAGLQTKTCLVDALSRKPFV